MPVVFNEFEVVPRADAPAAPAGAAPGATQATPPSPDEVARLLRHQIERQARVRAH